MESKFGVFVVHSKVTIPFNMKTTIAYIFTKHIDILRAIKNVLQNELKFFRNNTQKLHYVWSHFHTAKNFSKLTASFTFFLAFLYPFSPISVNRKKPIGHNVCISESEPFILRLIKRWAGNPMMVFLSMFQLSFEISRYQVFSGLQFV